MLIQYWFDAHPCDLEHLLLHWIFPPQLQLLPKFEGTLGAPALHAPVHCIVPDPPHEFLLHAAPTLPTQAAAHLPFTHELDVQSAFTPQTPPLAAF